MPDRGQPHAPVELASLVRWVRAKTSRCTELERLGLAVKIGIQLNRASDQLVGQFVEEARQGGASWAQIGERLGVTKQAAHQRHTRLRPLFGRRRKGGNGAMFDRFDQEVKEAIVRAQSEARALDHGWIGTEHLLLGVLGDKKGSGARLLGSMGVSLPGVRRRVEEVVGRGEDEKVGGPIPFTARAKKVLEVAVRAAKMTGHDVAGSGHLVLALVLEGEGVAAGILRQMGVREKDVRARLEQSGD